jgi:ribonuclease BN (tRNA processing enzyme)
MRILFLGSGSAHTVAADNFQSNMLLCAGNGRRLLIDCGSDIRWSLARQGLSHRDVTDIYVSHLHADHIGGLEYVGFKTRFDPACHRPRLYLDASLVGPLWDHSLRGGMGVITEGETRLEDFFEVVAVRAHEPFEWQGARLEAVPMAHVVAPQATMHSNGLVVDVGGRRVLLTTDTRFDPEHLAPYYARADLIFQDCETSAYVTGIHAHYSELSTLPAGVRAKMWLYDYPPGPLPDATANGFLGFVRPGQSFELTGLQKASTVK